MDKQAKNPCQECGSDYTYMTLKHKVCRKCGHRQDTVKDPRTDKEATNSGTAN